MSDRIVMEHEGIEGTPEVSRAAFEQTWRDKGWREVKPVKSRRVPVATELVDIVVDPDTEVTGG